MLTFIKNALRITGTDYDAELNVLIAACRADLVRSGLPPFTIDDTDPLIQQATATYVKANFGIENPDSEKYMASYQSQKAELIVLGENVGD